MRRERGFGAFVLRGGNRLRTTFCERGSEKRRENGSGRGSLSIAPRTSPSFRIPRRLTAGATPWLHAKLDGPVKGSKERLEASVGKFPWTNSAALRSAGEPGRRGPIVDASSAVSSAA